MTENEIPNFLELAEQASQMNRKAFKGFAATVRIAYFAENAAVSYKDLPGWRFDKVTVHADSHGRYQISSINGYALGSRGRDYQTQIGALRSAWVISHFTNGVLSESGELIADLDEPSEALKAMRSAVIFCDMEFRS